MEANKSRRHVTTNVNGGLVLRHHIDLLVGTNITDKHTAFIFRADVRSVTEWMLYIWLWEEPEQGKGPIRAKWDGDGPGQ